MVGAFPYRFAPTISIIHPKREMNCTYRSGFWPILRLNLWWIFTLISIILIIIIDFTQWRPVVSDRMDQETSNAVNKSIVTLCYSIFAASFFYLINDFFPQISRKKIIQKQINQGIEKIHQNLKFLISLPRQFSFSEKGKDIIGYTEESYASDFSELDLLERLSPNTPNLEETINRRRKDIQDICQNLITSYNNEMSVRELRYIDSVLSSNFLNTTLTPIIFDIPVRERIHYHSNQRFFGRCIYELYSLPVPIRRVFNSSLRWKFPFIEKPKNDEDESIRYYDNEY